MTAQERKEKWRESNPNAEAIQKEKERNRDRILRFHIRREELYGYEVPDYIDQEQECFKRIRAEYLEQMKQPVEVEVTHEG